MRSPRDLWLVGGVALMALAGFLVLRPQPVQVAEPDVPAPRAIEATSTTAPLVESLPESVSRVLADSGSAQVVDAGELAEVPDSVARVLIDRRAVLTLPEDTP